MVTSLFFVFVELFTVLYGDMPHHLHSFEYLFVGLGGKTVLAPWMWVSTILAIGSVVLLLLPGVRGQEGLLAAISVAVIAGIWIEKGMGLIVAGFVPSPLGRVTEYVPTVPEITITLGVYAIGFFVLSVLYKIVVSVRERVEPAKVVVNLREQNGTLTSV
jgi:molybdopterin-containing oxidoreductase family membrane subunit